jgi:hypothetical protein
MGADAAPYARLRRALDAGVLPSAEMAARECRTLAPEDALHLCLLMAKCNDPRFERAAIRWAGRAMAERPRIGFVGARELVGALEGLRGSSPPTAGARLSVLLQAAGADECARLVARFDYRA